MEAKHEISLDVSDLRFPKTRNNYKLIPGQLVVDPISIPTSGSIVNKTGDLKPSAQDENQVPWSQFDVKMIEIIPEPCYVMKLKDDSGSKFFVNVCSHSSIDTGNVFVSLQPKESVASDGAVCMVYDVVLNPEDISVVVLDKNILDTVSELHYLCFFS